MEVSGKIKNLYLFDKGSSKVSAVFDKDSFNVDETAHVECFVDNSNCTKTIKSIDIKLRRSIKGSVNLN